MQRLDLQKYHPIPFLIVVNHVKHQKEARTGVRAHMHVQVRVRGNGMLPLLQIPLRSQASCMRVKFIWSVNNQKWCCKTTLKTNCCQKQKLQEKKNHVSPTFTWEYHKRDKQVAGAWMPFILHDFSNKRQVTGQDCYCAK